MQALLGRFEGEDEMSNPMYIVHNTPAHRTLMKKISKNAKPGSILFVTDDEMDLLRGIYTLDLPIEEVPTLMEGHYVEAEKNSD